MAGFTAAGFLCHFERACFGAADVTWLCVVGQMRSKRPWFFILLGACGIVVFFLTAYYLFSPSAAAPVRTLVLKAGRGDTNAVTQLNRLGPKGALRVAQLLKARNSALWKAQERLGSRLLRVPMMKSFGRWILTKNGPEAAVYRIAAAETLGRLGSSGELAVAALLQALHDPQPEVRWRAATALAQIGTPAVEGLTRMLADVDPLVRQTAAYALGEMREQAESSLPTLLTLANDSNQNVRSSAVYSIAMIGFPSMFSLSNIIATGDASAREAAVRTLMQYRRSMRQNVPALIHMAQADSPTSRKLALESLAGLRFADDASMSALAVGLKDGSAEVRLAAVKALNQVIWRADRALPELQACLQDESPAVREWSLKTLGSLGPKASAALPQVERMAEAKTELSGLAAETAKQIRGH